MKGDVLALGVMGALALAAGSRRGARAIKMVDLGYRFSDEAYDEAERIYGRKIYPFNEVQLKGFRQGKICLEDGTPLTSDRVAIVSLYQAEIGKIEVLPPEETITGRVLPEVRLFFGDYEVFDYEGPEHPLYALQLRHEPSHSNRWYRIPRQVKIYGERWER